MQTQASLVSLLLTLALACTSASGTIDGGAITSDALLEGTVLGVTGNAATLADTAEVLAVSPEMREFLDRTVSPKAAAEVKLRQLIRAVVDADAFGLEFESATRTASEAYRVRRGNCLSFSNLFVAMAREVGLDASFQEVDVPPDWSLDNDVLVLNRHVNARVALEAKGDRVVDLNIGDFRGRYDTRTISDDRARAHFYNNIGVDRMREGDTASALAHLRRAVTESDGRFSPAWTNLGTLYLREGHPDHAEAAYLQALRADRRDTVAMSNLVRLYERRGDTLRTAAWQRKVARHRNRNPYFRYQRAREAFEAEDYETAVRHLRYALRKKPDEELFCSLLGMSYLKLGNERRGRRWLARARTITAIDTARP